MADKKVRCELEDEESKRLAEDSISDNFKVLERYLNQ
jgi:hypothetical protein